MNDPEFNRLDDWMMEIVKPEREKRLTENDLKEFHDGVMKKVIERQNRGFNSPYMGFAFAAAISLAVIFGAVLYMNSVKTGKPETAQEVKAAENKLTETQAPMAAVKTEPAVNKPAIAITPAPLTEANILDEIEALKELGAWTEDDEAEAGIPADVTFSDLEVGINVQPQAVPAPAA